MFLKCLGFCHSSSSQKKYPTVIEELCHQFSLANLRKLTNNFDQNRVLGRGGFAEVYKGYLQHDGAADYTVAVKRFNAEDVEGCKEFTNEIELLCQLHHPNCVSLIGFCNHKKWKILVYEYMSKGSLDRYLRGIDTEALPWKKRLEICIGTARALHYLHAGAKRTIIHRDICLTNILLNDNMEPKLAGFDLSIQGAHFMSKPKPIKIDHVTRGTAYYMATEYYKGRVVTDKSDVYSFGVVLLEVVWGKSYLVITSTGRELLEEPVEENIDANIKGKIAPECWQVFIDIIERCVKNKPDERPTMGEVEVQLEHALLLQEQADITNTNGDYTLLSKTIIPLGMKR